MGVTPKRGVAERKEEINEKPEERKEKGGKGGQKHKNFKKSQRAY